MPVGGHRVNLETPFAVRLEAARQLIARGTVAPQSTHLRDQVEAATNESHDLQALIGHTLQLINPTRNWRQFADWHPGDERLAHLLAGVLGCLPQTCPHLRRGPEPA